LQIRKIPFDRQRNLALEYKGLHVDGAYRIDLVVDNKVVLELKCCDAIAKAHEAQLLTYLRLSKIKVGLILNFNEATMSKGIRRMVL
jgi:GxxExxY protein